KFVKKTPNWLTSVDTSNISNFHLKVKSLLSAGEGILYNSTTGVISTTGSASGTLEGLSDVAIEDGAIDDVLVRDVAGNWRNKPSALVSLSDIDSADLAMWDGDKFIKKTPNWRLASEVTTLTATGDVTASASGTTTLNPVFTIGSGKVTNSMLAGSITS